MSARDFARRHVLHNLGLETYFPRHCDCVSGWRFRASRSPKRLSTSPSSFKNMPDDLEISSELIPSAQIRVRGPERLVRRLEASDVHEEIDLTGMKPGERTFDLNKNQVNLPDKLEVSQIVPSQIHLAFDNRSSRVVPVRPRVIGTFASGYSIGQIKSDPATVEIVGPKKLIDDVESAITDPIDASGLIDRTTYFRHAYVSDPLIQVTNPRPVRITVIMERAPLSSAPTQSQ